MPESGLRCQPSKTPLKLSAPETVAIQCTNVTDQPYTFRMKVERSGLDDGNESDLTQHVLEPRETQAVRSFKITPGKRWNLKFSGTQTLGRPMQDIPKTQHLLPFLEDQGFLVTQISTGKLSSHSEPHNQYAVDFSVPLGTPVVATHDGVVAFTKTGSTLTGKTPNYRGLENLVLLYDEITNTWTTYAHLDVEINVKVGDRLKAGDLIGRTGASGMMGGPHLHFAVEMRGLEKAAAIPFQFVDRNRVPIELVYAQRYVVR